MINANSIVQPVIEIKNGIIKHVNVNAKMIVSGKKDFSWNPITCICENSNYLKCNAYTSVIACDKIISVMDIGSTKMTNNIATNVTSISSINCHSKKVR